MNDKVDRLVFPVWEKAWETSMRRTSGQVVTTRQREQ
jgi:hypothetical protein